MLIRRDDETDQQIVYNKTKYFDSIVLQRVFETGHVSWDYIGLILRMSRLLGHNQLQTTSPFPLCYSPFIYFNA